MWLMLMRSATILTCYFMGILESMSEDYTSLIQPQRDDGAVWLLKCFLRSMADTINFLYSALSRLPRYTLPYFFPLSSENTLLYCGS